MNTCPHCDSGNVIEFDCKETFKWGILPVTCVVPVMHCKACGEQWTDYRAEELRAEAITRVHSK